MSEIKSNNSELPHSPSLDKPNTKKRLKSESSTPPSMPTKKNKHNTTFPKPPLTFAGEVFLFLNQSKYSAPIPSLSAGISRPPLTQTQETAIPVVQENSQASILVSHAQHSDSTSAKACAPKAVKETTLPDKESLDLISILNDIGTTDLLKKLSNGAKGYNLSAYKIKHTKKEKFISAIQRILDIDKVELVADNKVYISRDTINEYFKKFEKTVKPMLLPKDENRKILILKLFIRVFSIPVVEAIREYNIPLINMEDYTGKTYSAAVEKILNYRHTVPTENNTFSLRFSGKSGSAISDRFIIHEISNTRKKMNKSNQETWNDDRHLHMSIFPAIDKFLGKSKPDTFESKHIQSQINRRSPPTHFRPTAVIDIYNYLVQENIISANTAINFFDSSIGWLDRLTAAILCNNGKAFKGYVGFDPNPKVITAGNELIADLKPKYNPDFNAKLYQQGIETVNSNEIVKRIGGYSPFGFTSPPFFDAQEKYGLNGSNENAQAWKLYSTKDEYKRLFLKPLLQINFNILTAGGVFGLHFKEKQLLLDTLELINDGINNASMQMKVWREGVYYPKGGPKTSSEIIYLFRRPNRIEEIPTSLISVEEKMQQQACSSVEYSLSENANKPTPIYFHSDAYKDNDASFKEILNQELNQQEVLVPKVSVFSSKMVFFSSPSLNQSPADLMPEQQQPRTTPRH
ncbi:hypothetical protein [Legionella rowbothamii]|uniref:hypothetical protein n=1 Tax=Legionella rowbothamii TaxID=96229 RepID=UPI001054BF00|nr:hypothetical protein [Legionella rowbothamii]